MARRLRFEGLALETPTLPPATHTNCWRLGSVVIDPASPWPAEQERLWAWLADAPPTKILLTHHHADHTGGVEALRARCGASVWAHREARLPFEVDGRLEEGDAVETGAGVLRCLSTPGHADGHLCYRLETADSTAETVIGDMMAGIGTILLAPPEGHLATYMASLERLERLGGRFLPAHGAAMEDGAAVARMYLAHRRARTEQVRAALAQGMSAPEQIAAWIYAGVPGVNLDIAALQISAHLHYIGETS